MALDRVSWHRAFSHRLPWLAGAAGVLLYLITLNHWVSLDSLRTTTQVSGWASQPELTRPLTWLVLLPFRCLPAAWIPISLNLLAAICAGFVLVLLARSVALLPHDILSAPTPKGARPVPRPHLTRFVWLPPLVALVTCGLQLSFWEHATSFTGEMLDLLLFAYICRGLLEYRIDQKQAWLSRCSFLFGIGMANNWAMIGYLPLFLAVVLRLTGFRALFNRRWFLRLVLWGLAGLALYLLLPVVQSLSGQGSVAFWPALKANLKSQKEMLAALRRPALRLLTFASLVPLLVLSIRWKSHTMQASDDSRLGVFLTKAAAHIAHALLLLLSLWMALDPTFSPRHLGGPPMLTYYYVSAIVAAYCAGYFLLLGTRGDPARISRITAGGLSALAGLLALALVARNLGEIRFTNGPAARSFARHLCEDLPAGKTIVLGEDPRQFSLLQAELYSRPDHKEALLVDARLLAAPGYRALIVKRSQDSSLKWLTNYADTLGPVQVLNLASQFAAHSPVTYLHPGFSPFCERFDPRSHGLIQSLEPLSPSNPAGSKLDDASATANEHVWQSRWDESLASLAARTQEKPRFGSGWAGALRAALRLPNETNATARFLGAAYSKALNCWGVERQRLGNWKEAAVWFERAVGLSPDTLAAHINARYNARWQKGDRLRSDAAAIQKDFRELFARYRNWHDVLNQNGYIDEPAILLQIGQGLLGLRNPRQAVRELERCAELAPDWPEPRLWLAQGYVVLRAYAAALAMTERIIAEGQPSAVDAQAQLLFCRTCALAGLGRTNEATAGLEKLVREQSGERELLSDAAGIFAENRQFDPALFLLEPLLTREPDNPKLLTRKAAAELQLGRYDAAVATLTKVLTLTPGDHEARLDRAVASAAAGQLDAAQEDYQQLLKTPGASANALYGLAGIAWRKHNTNQALELYQKYISAAPPDSPQTRLALRRVRELKKALPR